MGLDETFARACEVMGAEKGFVNGVEVYRRHPLVLFTGSRDWDNDWTVLNVLLNLQQTIGTFSGVHGGARGLDRIVDAWMKRLDLEVETVRPRYKEYHPKVAPKRRNIEMLDRRPDLVVGFWTGSKGGTTHCLEFAINIYRIPVLVITT